MMIRMIMVWAILSVAIGVGIAGWQTLTGKEKWQLTKYAVYATVCSLVAVVLLSFVVILF
jgi:hypothetical protein